ncbi:hypothetical protein PoB_005300500 [Plakobranchus ocellatus]|uniref:Thioesterase domain-containing protein n=1 Tax=Plakobranchus ocellatus TaxID=259542 RepID=A0AAV4C1G9_9GAST|nr:hypothetical protein PoB_005300500 [Plakobranchus ocellatus]
MSCEPEIYDPKVVKQPVEIDFELVYVGNTSYMLRNYLYLPQFKKPLAKKDVCLVVVDKDTHRPQKLPDWWKEKYSQYSLPAEKPISFKSFDFAQPGAIVQHENIVVRTTDLDGLCHVNNASFVRFCYEAYIACHVRQFGYTPQADPYRNVKTVSCVFKGEAELGNLLQVSFVQDPDNRDTYHFQILKNPGGIIFESCLEFFPQLSSKY